MTNAVAKVTTAIITPMGLMRGVALTRTHMDIHVDIVQNIMDCVVGKSHVHLRKIVSSEKSLRATR